MFRIHEHQIAALQQTAASAFEEEMVEHCAAFSPRIAAALAPSELLTIVRAAITRAAGHGFTLRGPVRLFIELSFLFGSAFDTDVQYPWARALLSRAGETGPVGTDLEQMDCASALHSAAMEAQRAIRGADDSHAEAALRRVLKVAAEPVPHDVADLPALGLKALKRVHTEKYAFVGKPALLELIAAATDEAARHHLAAPRDVLLFVGLMFAYGQGCTKDPIHAWIGETLTDPALSTPGLRARQLEERALTAVREALAST